MPAAFAKCRLALELGWRTMLVAAAVPFAM
jgi:hypothetical protein